ncbi:biotin transporter BioY [Alicyclobacillus contaminans]|uniref:biotin transporter BioY n=1 Tax=Alicyclobacillus contaminans TaxID=392016 RepID=UPI000422C39F|nr:biotin transporter BioY [Alicyclobacillus contaminans]GMA51274.1 biotin transporter BioY [Alicyclobacillus contaminans]
MKFTRGIVFSALFAALLAVFSLIQIPVPGSPVPVVLENIVPMLAGALLGPGYGFLSIVLVIVLTLLGVPMIDGQGGVGHLFGPTGGYIWAWPFNALLTGWVLKAVKTERMVLRSVLTFVVIEVFGGLACYLLGVPWLAAKTHMSLGKAMVLGCYPYLFGDTLKALVATIITVAVRRVYPEGVVAPARQRIVALDKGSEATS